MGLYLVPASGENLRKTIIRDVDMSVAKRFLISADFKRLEELLGTKKQFNCWAMTESNRAIFEKMVSGDMVLITEKNTGKFNYMAEVFFTVVCEEMGNYLWDYVPNKSWKLIYFMNNMQQINIAKNTLASALGYKSNYQVQGTIRIKDYKVGNIVQEYGSIESFLKNLGYSGETKSIKKSKYIEILESKHPKWLLPIIKNIEILMDDFGHKERAHESLVESFYELLGFSKYNEIKHRQGRVDIGIEVNGKVLIVNEVKKDWDLSYKSEDAVKQGYVYAFETGARFVVITNGDYYAIFDRNKGLDKDSSFVGEFKLTKLNENSLSVIEKLKKKNLSELDKVELNEVEQIFENTKKELDDENKKARAKGMRWRLSVWIQPDNPENSGTIKDFYFKEKPSDEYVKGKLKQCKEERFGYWSLTQI